MFAPFFASEFADALFTEASTSNSTDPLLHEALLVLDISPPGVVTTEMERCDELVLVSTALVPLRFVQSLDSRVRFSISCLGFCRLEGPSLRCEVRLRWWRR